MYKTGELAKMSGVSIRTIRYYDSKGLLTPSAYSKSGHRLYTDEDFSKLKRILALKYLGFSLEEVMNMEATDFSKENMVKTFSLQKQILKNKIHHMKTVFASIEAAESSTALADGLSWSQTIDIIKIIESEKILRQKFIDASHLNAEIKLSDAIESDKNWYKWVFERLDFKEGDHVLELGCGEGALWYKNEQRLAQPLNVVLTEVTDDLLRNAKENLLQKFPHFKFEVARLEQLDFPDETFDVVIANHVLFFLKDAHVVLAEINRLLKRGGRFYCSTIDKDHMKELEALIKGYHQHIKLGKSEQLQNFGYEKAKALLENQFMKVKSYHYGAELVVHHAEELLDYLYSIPGHLLDVIQYKKKEFEAYVQKQMREISGFKISNCHILFSSEKGEE